MVSALDSRSGGLGLNTGWGHCVLFLGKTLFSHSASLHPGAQMITGEINVGGNSAMDWHPIQWGAEYSWSLKETGISSCLIGH